MASIFPKADPKDESAKRWMAKVKVCGEWRSISLRLRVVPGTKREAQQRADSLQAEIKAGILSDATRVWLGDVTAAKLAVEIGRGRRRSPRVAPTHGKRRGRRGSGRASRGTRGRSPRGGQRPRRRRRSLANTSLSLSSIGPLRTRFSSSRNRSPKQRSGTLNIGSRRGSAPVPCGMPTSPQCARGESGWPRSGFVSQSTATASAS